MNRQELRALVEAHARLLRVDPETGIDPVAVLLAIAEIETSGGVRWEASKHEDGYCYGSNYYRRSALLRERSTRWGCSAHSSWGIWQIMDPTAAEFGHEGDPVALRDPSVALPYVCAVINRRVLDRLADETPADIFDSWNTGNPRDRYTNTEYTRRAMAAYRIFTVSGEGRGGGHP